MSEYLIQSDTLTGIADAIREKVGSSDDIDPAQMAELIAGIQAGDEVRVVWGAVTLTENLSGRIPLFSVGDPTLEAIPDFLLVYYNPKESKRNDPVVGLQYMSVTFKYNDSHRENTNIIRTSSRSWFPSYSGDSHITASEAIVDGMLMSSYSSGSATYTAGESYYYLAIYGKGDMRGA